MNHWIEFEIECTDFLNEHFGSHAHFFHQGGSDSTVPDIFVQTDHGMSFYMEAKCSPAQCGQFVLLPDLSTRTFVYSPKNSTPINLHARKMIDYMNEQFDEFREAGTTGKDLVMNPQVFSDWIIQTYKEKGVRFFITNHHTLVPIEKFQNYFTVSAKYRIKRSGSDSVGKRQIPLILAYLHSHDPGITGTRTNVKKLFVTSDQNLHDRRFILGAYEYMFSQREDEYEIRKLSNTYNANVIFSIRQISSVPGLSEEDFIHFLRQDH